MQLIKNGQLYTLTIILTFINQVGKCNVCNESELEMSKGIWWRKLGYDIMYTKKTNKEWLE